MFQLSPHRDARRPLRLIALILAGSLALAACGSGRSTDSASNTEVTDSSDNGGFLGLFGGSDDDDSSGVKQGKGTPTEIGVNSFLWRASLDTVSFMPLISADPFGGVIITDWYSAADAPDERFKLTVYILDKRLRADGLRVSVFRQVRERNGQWRDSEVSDDTAIRLENAILVRARQLRIDTIQE